MFYYVKISDITIEQIFALQVMIDFVGKSSRSFYCNFVADAEFSRALRFGGDYILQMGGTRGVFRIDSNLFDILCEKCHDLMILVNHDNMMVLRPG